LAISQGFFIEQIVLLDITLICDRLPVERETVMYLEGGSFVRVRKDLDDYRRGKDAQVYKDLGNQVGLLFGRDKSREWTYQWQKLQNLGYPLLLLVMWL